MNACRSSFFTFTTRGWGCCSCPACCCASSSSSASGCRLLFRLGFWLDLSALAGLEAGAPGEEAGLETLNAVGIKTEFSIGPEPPHPDRIGSVVVVDDVARAAEAGDSFEEELLIFHLIGVRQGWIDRDIIQILSEGPVGIDCGGKNWDGRLAMTGADP